MKRDSLSHIKKGLTLLFLMLTANAVCFGQQKYRYVQPKQTTDGWKTGSLTTQSADTAAFNKLFNQLTYEANEMHSVLVVKNNKLIVEEYFNGYSMDTPHDLRSTTKSIRSILMGIAIDNGDIKNVNDPIFNYLKTHVPKKNKDERKNKITIRHLLTMASGLDCNDWDKKSKGQEDRVYKKKDWVQYTLNLPLINDPGAVSTYCSMGAVLIAEIISQASGISIDTFAQKHLFTPLGIQSVNWGHTSKKEIIPAGKRLYMTPRDMAKIGQLMLNKGQWNGKKVVSAKWVEESTTPATKITGMDYGYFWWEIPFEINGKKIISKTATGNGGQYIMIFPTLNMVAVFTGGAYNSQRDKLPFSIMQHVFLPLFVNAN